MGPPFFSFEGSRDRPHKAFPCSFCQMAVVSAPLWNPYSIATVVHVTFQMTASLTSRCCPLIWVAIYMLCGICTVVLSDYTVVTHIKWFLVVWLGGISAMCCSAPQLRSRVVQARSGIGLVMSLVLISNIAWMLLRGLGTVYDRISGACSVLLCIWIVVLVATHTRQGRPCFDVSAAGVPLTLFTPTCWVCSYAVWNAVLCWPRSGLMFTLHVLVDLPIFMMSLARLERVGEVQDVGYYFGFARAVGLSNWSCERSFVQRPFFPNIEKFTFSDDISGVLLGLACLNALFVLVNLGFAFHGLWCVHTQDAEQVSEHSGSKGTDQGLP